MKTTPILTLIAASILASACTTATPQPSARPTPSLPAAPVNAVDGQWRDKDGVISNFSNGRFETLTADSNTALAIGTYTETGNLVEIELTSVVRRTQSRVNCMLNSPYLLNCTPSQGAQFSLYKPSAAPVGFTLQDVPTMNPPATTGQVAATMPGATTGTAPTYGYGGTQTGGSF
ncbi:hypothetical protein [Martelella limonii]|uniref:hypothetical protein n=1 Tax=Martelella limonii TaxID=1647649 RepID=UPI001580CBAA|nr:hypothetical protein [Martelella limonii]